MKVRYLPPYFTSTLLNTPYTTGCSTTQARKYTGNTITKASITVPPISYSEKSWSMLKISISRSGKRVQSPGSGMILLRNGNVHRRRNGTAAASAVLSVFVDTSMAVVAANRVPIYPPAMISRYAWRLVML